MSSIASLITKGSGHRFLLDGYATNSVSSSFYIANGTSDESGAYTSNTVEIVNGSMLELTNDNLYTRNYANGTVAANGNTVRIASGGKLRCREFVLCCADNTLVVSNGTLECFFSDALMCGGTQTGGSISVPTTGARVILEGENPLICSTGSSGTAYFRDGTKVIFRPSPNGFTTSAALMSYTSYSTDGTATLAFEGLADVQKNLRRTAIYTLAEARGASGTVAFTDEQLAAATGLIDGCRLYKSDDGKRLLLRIRANRGTVFTVR